MKRVSPLGAASFALLVASVAACTHRQATLLPVGPLLPARGPSCPVEVEDQPEPGTKTLALARCTDGVLGDDCTTLLKEKACEAGGDVLFGVHYEKSGTLVGSIGRLSAESIAERQMTRRP
jgi:hypothetical protein